MRIVQIIDSLEAGGAEMMAVNYANALSTEIAFSGLIATRKEGILLKKIDKKVAYFFLNKTKVVDISAVFKLRKYCKSNQIQFIHAHSSSFFIAVLVKILLPKVKIIWHDHYGNSEFLLKRKYFILKIASYFFTGIVSVNSALQNWANIKLNGKKTTFLANFPDLDSLEKETQLNGNSNKKIVCVANLRPQKDILFLLDLVNFIKLEFPDWSFHVIGKHFNDDYQHKIYEKINSLDLQKNVYFYTSVSDVHFVLSQANIGILTSVSEGLPMAILEYGMVGLPVIASDVGDVKKIITHNKNGILFEAKNLENAKTELKRLITDQNLQHFFGQNLKLTIQNDFSKANIIKQYLNFLNGN